MSQDLQQSKPTNTMKLAARRLKTNVVDFFNSRLNTNRDNCNHTNITLESNNNSSKQNFKVFKSSEEAVPKKIAFLPQIDKDYQALMSELVITSKLFVEENCIILQTLIAMMAEYFKEDDDCVDNCMIQLGHFENINDLFRFHKNAFESGISTTDTTDIDEKNFHLIAKTIGYLTRYYKMNEEQFDFEVEPILIWDESIVIKIERLFSLAREYNRDVYSLIERFRISYPDIDMEQLYGFCEALARLLDDYCPHERSKIDANLQDLAKNQKSEPLEKNKKKALRHFFNSRFNSSRGNGNRTNITLKSNNKSSTQNSQVIKTIEEAVPEEIALVCQQNKDYETLLSELVIASEQFIAENNIVLETIFAMLAEFFKETNGYVDNCVIKPGIFANICDLYLWNKNYFEYELSIIETTEIHEKCFKLIAKTIDYLTIYNELKNEEFHFELERILLWEESIGIKIKSLFSLPRKYNQDVFSMIERFRIRYPDIDYEQLYGYRESFARLLDDHCLYESSEIGVNLHGLAEDSKSEQMEKKKRKGLKQFFKSRFNASRDYYNRREIVVDRQVDKDYETLLLELIIASELFVAENYIVLETLLGILTEWIGGPSDFYEKYMIHLYLLEVINELFALHKNSFMCGINITDTAEFNEKCFHCMTKTIAYIKRYLEMKKKQFNFEELAIPIWEESTGIVIEKLFSLPREYIQDVYSMIERFRIRYTDINHEQLYGFQEALARLLDDYCPLERSEIDDYLRKSAENQKFEPMEKKKKKGLKHFFSRRK